jgi:uncharacterized protein HemX
VVELKPADPKVVYIPQYNPEQVFQTTTTTTTRPDGTVTSTTTTTGPAPATSSSSNTTTVVKEKEGVSTGTAAMIGVLAFGAGIAVGSAINSNKIGHQLRAVVHSTAPAIPSPIARRANEDKPVWERQGRDRHNPGPLPAPGRNEP